MRINVFAKALSMIFITAVCVATIPALQYSVILKGLVFAQLTERASATTQSLADRSAGALRFGKLDKVTEEMESLLVSEGADLVGVAAYRAGQDGETLSGTIGDQDAARMANLGQLAMDTGAPQTDATMLIFAWPVIMGQSGTIVGAIASQWTATDQMTQVSQASKRSWILILLVLGGFVLAATLLLRRWLSRPLEDVAAAMVTVSNGHLDTDVPHLGKGDEIGRIARALDGSAANCCWPKMPTGKRA